MMEKGTKQKVMMIEEIIQKYWTRFWTFIERKFRAMRNSWSYFWLSVWLIFQEFWIALAIVMTIVLEIFALREVVDRLPLRLLITKLGIDSNAIVKSICENIPQLKGILSLQLARELVKSLLVLVIVSILTLIIVLWKRSQLLRRVDILILDNIEKTKLRKRIRASLSSQYKKSKYVYKLFQKPNYGCEAYLMSPAVNRALQTQKEPLLLVKSAKYDLPSPVKKLLLKVMNVALSGDRLMTNNKLVRQNSSLLLNDKGKLGQISISQVRYYDGQGTHELLYHNFTNKEELGIAFRGSQLLLNEQDKLYSLEESHSANFIGVSTLVITRDNRVLIARQGLASNANAGRYAPSGSGSVDWKDYQKHPRQTLDGLLIRAVEREFYEEWNISKKHRGFLQTRLIGYSRLIEKGGKPDYFALSFSSKTYEEIKMLGKGKVRFLEKGVQEVSDEFLSFTQSIEVRDGLKALCDQHAKENRISIQLHIFQEIITQMIDDGVFDKFIECGFPRLKKY